MSDVVNLDGSNFEAEVLNSDVPVLVDFSASWCGPCKRMAPMIEKLAAENNNIKVCKLDIDDAPEIASKLGIRSVPTLVLFNAGGIVGSKVGLSSFADISNFVITKTSAQ